MQPSSTKKLEILKALSNVVKKKRIELDKSQRFFAFEYGLQKSMISRFENLKNEPKMFSLWRVANALGIKPSELFSLIEDELGEYVDLTE